MLNQYLICTLTWCMVTLTTTYSDMFAYHTFHYSHGTHLYSTVILYIGLIYRQLKYTFYFVHELPWLYQNCYFHSCLLKIAVHEAKKFDMVLI